MRRDRAGTEELMGKYRLAGKIRFISFSLLFFFLFLMKSVGGYSYLSPAFMTLIIVEALLNQPYGFIVRRVHIERFQYFQMITDIIAISWVMYYMGGIDAPVVSIAYYVIILWAGVASTPGAVFFAVTASSFFFASITLLEYFGLIPPVFPRDSAVTASKLISLLVGNISFLFAFGYFSAYSSMVTKSIERKRQEEALRSAHKLMASGYLVGRTAHDLLNTIISTQGYAGILLEMNPNDAEKRKMLEAIERLQKKGSEMVTRLGHFAQDEAREFHPVDFHKTIEDALDLTFPIVRYSRVAVERIYGGASLPLIMASKDELQEIFVVFLLNALDAMPDGGKLIIKTEYIKKEGMVSVSFSDTGTGIKEEHLKRLGEPFFTTKEQGKAHGLGLATAYGIIERHGGRVDVKSAVGRGSTFTVMLPVAQQKDKAL